MIRILVVISIIVGLALIIMNKRQSLSDSKTLIIGNAKLEVEIAAEMGKRYQGLSGREQLCENCGMLFIFDKQALRLFTMRGMRFPLDMIFIRDNRVVEIHENIPNAKQGEAPVKIRSNVEADIVLEVNAGLVDKSRIKIGDIIRLD